MKDHKSDTEDLILKSLQDLPNGWEPMVNTLRITMMVDREDVGWLMSRIAEDVDRGLVSAHIGMQKSSSSCGLEIVFQTVSDIANNPIVQTTVAAALTMLIREIREGLIRKRKQKMMKDKEIAGVS
jgi:hypothetical protein